MQRAGLGKGVILVYPRSRGRTFSFLFVFSPPSSPGSEALVLVQESSFSFTGSVMNVHLQLSLQKQHTFGGKLVLVSGKDKYDDKLH